MKHVTRYDYIARRMALAQHFGTNDVDEAITRLYSVEMLSAQEISTMLLAANIAMTPRTIQRIVNKSGKIRPIGDAFRLAAKRGRIKWHYKDARLKAQKNKLSPKTRYGILKRDSYKCVLCGNNAQNTVLEVDHIIALTNGGTDAPENLRTLCHDCNVGKRIEERER